VAADPDDPEAVADAVRRVAQDPSQLAEMGRRARAIARVYDKVSELQTLTRTLQEVVP
jgi:glycosyltransferase involved in cell wall biosynthesis